jgi:hypothetical protein
VTFLLLLAFAAADAGITLDAGAKARPLTAEDLEVIEELELLEQLEALQELELLQELSTE